MFVLNLTMVQIHFLAALSNTSHRLHTMSLTHYTPQHKLFFLLCANGIGNVSYLLCSFYMSVVWGFFLYANVVAFMCVLCVCIVCVLCVCVCVCVCGRPSSTTDLLCSGAAAPQSVLVQAGTVAHLQVSRIPLVSSGRKQE